MTDICPIRRQDFENDYQSIQCYSCNCCVHHNNRRNCSALTNREFKTHVRNTNKFWQCDTCCTSSKFNIPFSDLDDDSWREFIGLNRKITSDDVNILSAKQTEFVAQLESIKGYLKENDDDDEDVLLNNLDCKYYDIKQLNDAKIDTSSSFGFFHTNIASLNLHADDLRLILSRLNYKFDVIGITEHKIHKNTVPFNNISIPGYHEFIYEPTETSHGGAGLFLKDNLDYIVRNDLQLNVGSKFEAIFIEIQFPKKKILCCIYRHLKSDISVQEFSNVYLEPVLQRISKENKHCVLMGDFNVDLLKMETHNDSNEFYNNLSSHFFTPYVIHPTRLRAKTIIDNILFNSLEFKSLSGNLLIEISDHLIQMLILEGFVKERSIPEINMYRRDFSNFNEREFQEEINKLNWNNICELNKNDPDVSCKNFFNGITFLLDEHAPFKKVSKKEYKLMHKP